MIPILTHRMEIPIWMHPSNFLKLAGENGFIEACDALGIEITFETEERGKFFLILTGNSFLIIQISKILNDMGIETPHANPSDIPEA